jgi:integrase
VHKAVEWGYPKANPLTSVKFLKEPLGRLRYLTHDEMDALLTACSPHLQPIVLTAVHAGMRKSEILGLRWQDLGFTAKTITVRHSKNNEPKVIPMNRTLYEELRQRPQHLHFAYVFCNSQGDPYDEVKRSFKTACRKAGVHEFRFHDLRHTFASHLVMNVSN